MFIFQTTFLRLLLYCSSSENERRNKTIRNERSACITETEVIIIVLLINQGHPNMCLSVLCDVSLEVMTLNADAANIWNYWRISLRENKTNRYKRVIYIEKRLVGVKMMFFWIRQVEKKSLYNLKCPTDHF